jgi:hypothetical protein
MAGILVRGVLAVHLLNKQYRRWNLRLATYGESVLPR